MTGSPHGSHDRKLGDEWNDWKGDADPRDRDIDERVSTFLTLASGVLFVSVVLLLLGWFMIKPRFEQIDPSFAQLTGWLLAGVIAGFVLAIFFEGGLLIRKGRSFLPYSWAEKFFLSLLPGTLWLGGKFGISKDRVGNSFIKIHNIITKGHVGRQNGGKLLVLLPRCLKKEARQELTGRLSGDDYKIFTATGGEEAREAIRQYRPASILAIACERDLMSGIKDVADKIPVIAIPNKRPEGPCKNTEFSIPDLEEALKVLRE
jgi:hypothetical protein